MEFEMSEYLKQVREQLDCNATDEYKDTYIVYIYSNEEIDNNLDYFERCKKNGLSPYKSLLFFHDYLNGDYNI